MRPHRLALIAATTLTVLSLSACGDDSDPDETGSDSPGTDTSQADEDFVSGDPEEWLHAVCGDDVEVSQNDDPAGLEARYGEDATESSYCSVQFDQGADDYSYPEAALYSADPTEQWSTPPDEGKFKSYAIGQVSEDQWAVVYEDSGLAELTDPHLEPLTELGFDVVINNEPVG